MLKTYVKTRLAVEKLKEDVKGASLVEYSLLIGIISAAVVVTIGLIGGKVVGWWQALDAAT